jgi:nicotinamide-nucleotide amidase
MHGLKLGTAESCTGGLVAATLTDRPGASDVVELGVVTYSNAAKTLILGVPHRLLADHGAVSAEVAGAMASGALAHFPALDVAVSITGVAGPGGGSAAKPVGLVYIAALRRGHEPVVRRHLFDGNRQAVREASVREALALLLEAMPPAP